MTTDRDHGGTGAISDEELMATIAAGADRAAFAELFGRYAGRIKAYLIRGGAAADAAEEVAQEVMVSVWRKAASYDPIKASVATWIYTIARNRRIDHIRRESRPEPDPTDPLFRPEPEPSAETGLAQADRDARVRAALAALVSDQRQVVELAFFSGLSHADIAQTLDVPLGTVKSRLRLAFGHLRGALGAGFSEELFDE